MHAVFEDVSAFVIITLGTTAETADQRQQQWLL